jgi:hypothetical protein
MLSVRTEGEEGSVLISDIACLSSYLGPQGTSLQRKLPQVRGREAFDQVLLDSARRGNDHVHHAMLQQVAEGVA